MLCLYIHDWYTRFGTIWHLTCCKRFASAMLCQFSELQIEKTRFLESITLAFTTRICSPSDCICWASPEAKIEQTCIPYLHSSAQYMIMIYQLFKSKASFNYLELRSWHLEKRNKALLIMTLNIDDWIQSKPRQVTEPLLLFDFLGSEEPPCSSERLG